MVAQRNKYNFPSKSNAFTQFTSATVKKSSDEQTVTFAKSTFLADPVITQKVRKILTEKGIIIN